MIYVFLFTFIFGILLFLIDPYIDVVTKNKIILWYTDLKGDRKFKILKNGNKKIL